MEWINPGDKISLIIEKHRLNVRYKNDSVFVINKISYVDVCDSFFYVCFNISISRVRSIKTNVHRSPRSSSSLNEILLGFPIRVNAQKSDRSVINTSLEIVNQFRLLKLKW